MAKHKPEIDETLPEWDCGTYQTGSTTPPKTVSGKITLLLLLVIFLGGLVSALGILNLQLIRQLSQKPGAVIPVSQGEFTLPVAENSIFFDNNIPTPAVPKNRQVNIQMVDSPYYSNNTSQLAVADEKAVYEANQQSLVEIYALSHANSIQSAVGVILSADGYILANAHIVEAAKRIIVFLSDGRLLSAAVVGSDNMTDLAVLYVQADDLTPATFGTSKTLQVADPIYTVSLQNDNQMPMRISADSMFSASRKFATQYYTLNLLQTCRKSSSGPLFNSFGQIVGLCISRTSQYFHESNTLGIVLGSNSMQAIITQLVERGYVSGRPDLGFEVEAVSKLFQHYWDLPGGLMVSGILPDSDPQINGLENGDIILALDGEPMNNRDDMYTVLYSCSIGQQIIAVVFRNGTKITVTLTVAELGA